MKKPLLVGFCAAALLLFAAPAFAGFATSVTGNGQLVSTPPSNAAMDFNKLYQVWNESSGTISSSVTLENNGADGPYAGNNTGMSTTLTTGTAYGSTFVQLNPGVDGPVGSGTATILFSTPIIGIALSDTSLNNTDKYGFSGTTYPTGTAGRGITPRVNQFFTITDGGKELEVHFTAQFDSFREIRVFTAGSSVSSIPEPASMVVWSVLGGVAICSRWVRRRRVAR